MAGKPLLLTETILSKTTMTYKVQFFHGGQGIWKDAGGHTFTEREAARDFMTAQSKMCDGMVDFRIMEVA